MSFTPPTPPSPAPLPQPLSPIRGENAPLNFIFGTPRRYHILRPVNNRAGGISPELPQPSSGAIGMEVRDPRARARGLSPEAHIRHMNAVTRRAADWRAQIGVDEEFIRGLNARLDMLIEAARPRIKVPCLDFWPECQLELNETKWTLSNGLNIKEVCLICHVKQPVFRGNGCGCVAICEDCAEPTPLKQLHEHAVWRSNERLEKWAHKWTGHYCTDGVKCKKEKERNWASDQRPNCLNCINSRIDHMIRVRYSARIRARLAPY